MSLMQVQNISKHYGGVQALSNVSLDIGANQFYAIIGPNGAGKSTLLNVMTGLVPPTRHRPPLRLRLQRSRRRLIRSSIPAQSRPS